MTTSNGKILTGLLMTWIVPGLGHFSYGRRDKGILFGILILTAFVGGMWLGEWRIVSADKYALYLIAQVWAGGPTLLALLLTKGLRITHDIPQLDAGLLYTAVAGLLNIVVLVDLYEIHLKIRAGEKAPAAVAGSVS